MFLATVVASFFLFKSCTSTSGDGNSGLFKDEVTTYEIKPSALRLGLEIDITSFEPMLNSNLETLGWMYQEDNVEVNNELVLGYRVKKEGQAMLYPQEGKLHLDLPLLIEIKAKARAPLAVPVTKKYDMTSRLQLHSVIDVDYEPDWSLKTTIETDYTILEAPEISVLGQPIRFEKQLKSSLDEALPMINKQIEEQITSLIDTRGIAENIWDTFRVPYHITNEPFTMWASLFPKKAEATAIKPIGPGIVGTHFQVSSTASVYLGNEPIPECRDELPQVTKIKKTDNDYSLVNIPLFLELAAMEAYLNEYYSQVEIQIPRRKAPIQLSNFKVEKAGNKLKLNTDFTSGKISGQLVLKGVPKYNNNTETIYVDQLQLSSESNNFVVDELVKLLKDNKDLKESLQYEITNDISQLTFDLTNLIKSYTIGEYTKMDGYIDKISINDILLQDDYIVLDAAVKGQLKCIVGF